MRIVFSWLLILVAGGAMTQVMRSPLTASYTGTGTYSKNFTDAFSVISNVGSLADFEHATVGAYSEQRFLLNELSSFVASVVLPTRGGGIGVNAHYFGGVHFNQSQAGLAYARKLGEQVNLGVQFNYHTMQVAGYGKSQAVTVDIGSLWKVSKTITIGLQVNNLLEKAMESLSAEKLATVYKIGIGYEATERFFFSAEIGKEEDASVNVTAGMQYRFARQFFSRAVVSTATGQYAAGVGFSWKACRVELVTAFHPRLGFTPGILILFQKNESKEENTVPK